MLRIHVESSRILHGRQGKRWSIRTVVKLWEGVVAKRGWVQVVSARPLHGRLEPARIGPVTSRRHYCTGIAREFISETVQKVKPMPSHLVDYPSGEDG
jgi:hypothetical protein